MASTPRTRIRLGLGLVALIPVLVACSPDGGTDPETTTAQTTTPTSTQTTTTTTSEAPSPTTTGSRIVGWTTMGTTSIVTVVDNDGGLVLQQMVSSDRIDPEDRIYELGLVEPPADWEPSPTVVPETTTDG